jgi:hypothetical protein
VLTSADPVGIPIRLRPVAEADVEDHRKDLGPFVVAAETTRMAMVFTDAKDLNNSIVFANDSFLSSIERSFLDEASSPVTISVCHRE